MVVKAPTQFYPHVADFRLIFLDYFFPANKTNALKKEIQACRQDYDESLSQYWSRFKGLLDSCSNNRMIEAEVYNIFYEGMNLESKDLMNSLSGENFTKKRVSEAREILGRLIDAKKAYDQPRAILRRGSANSVAEQGDEKVEARIDRLEKLLLSAIEKNNLPAPAEKAKGAPGLEEVCLYYGPSGEAEYPAQVNAVGSWSQNGHWIPGKQRDTPWRDHPNFRLADPNQNPQPQPQNTTYQNPPENQPNWSNRNKDRLNNWWNRNQDGQNNWGNRNQDGQNNWGNRNQEVQNNWENRNQGNQPNWSNNQSN